MLNPDTGCMHGLRTFRRWRARRLWRRLLAAAVGVQHVVMVRRRELVHRVGDHVVDADHVPHVLQADARRRACPRRTRSSTLQAAPPCVMRVCLDSSISYCNVQRKAHHPPSSLPTRPARRSSRQRLHACAHVIELQRLMPPSFRQKHTLTLSRTLESARQSRARACALVLGVRECVQHAQRGRQHLHADQEVLQVLAVVHAL